VRLYLETNFLYVVSDPLDIDHLDCLRILQIAEAERVEIVIPTLSIVEAQRGYERKHFLRLNKFEDVKTLIRNGIRAGIPEAKQIEIDEFDVKTQALFEVLDRYPILDRVKKIAKQIDPNGSFNAVYSRLSAALTSGEKKAPFLMEEIDRLVFATVVSHVESNQHDQQPIFCTRDKVMCEAAKRALTLYPCELTLTSSFIEALGLIKGS
jgi:hypothetical protein